MADTQVRDNATGQRYEAVVDGRIAGSAHYRLTGDGIEFTHTKVSPEYEGQGVGAALARFALDDAKRRGLSVTPTCEFIESYIRRHPEYAELVS